ncbi:U95 [Human betaherpesvirus 6B]|nr:U95 [Human betaherpesvirus 6B]
MSSNLEDLLWQQILSMDPAELLSDNAISSTCDENIAAGHHFTQSPHVEMSVQSTTSAGHTGVMTTQSQFSNGVRDQNRESLSTLTGLSLESINNQINVQPTQMTFQPISPPMQGQNYVYSNNMINPIKPRSIIKSHGHSMGEMSFADHSLYVNAQPPVQQPQLKSLVGMHPCMTATSQGKYQTNKTVGPPSISASQITTGNAGIRPGEYQSVHNQSSVNGSKSYEITTASGDEWILTTPGGQSWTLKRNPPNPPNNRTNSVVNKAQQVSHAQPYVSGSSDGFYQGAALQSCAYVNTPGFTPVCETQNMNNSQATQLSASMNCINALQTTMDAIVTSTSKPVGAVSNNRGANFGMGGMENYMDNNSPWNQYCKVQDIVSQNCSQGKVVSSTPGIAPNLMKGNGLNVYGHVGCVDAAISDKQGGTANVASSLLNPEHQDWMRVTGTSTNLLNNINAETKMENYGFPENGNVHGAVNTALPLTLSSGQPYTSVPQHGACEGNGTIPVVQICSPNTAFKAHYSLLGTVDENNPLSVRESIQDTSFSNGCAPQLSSPGGNPTIIAHSMIGNNGTPNKDVCKPTPSLRAIKKLNFDYDDRGENIGFPSKLAALLSMGENMSKMDNPCYGTSLAQFEESHQQNASEGKISIADLEFSEEDDVLSSAASVSCNDNCVMKIGASQQGTTVADLQQGFKQQMNGEFSMFAVDGNIKTQEMSNDCASNVTDNACAIRQNKRMHCEIGISEDGRVREEEKCSDVAIHVPRKSARIHNMKSEGVTCGMCVTAADSTRQDASGGSSSGTKKGEKSQGLWKGYQDDDDSELTELSDTDSDNDVQNCHGVRKTGSKTYSSVFFNPDYRQAKRLLADIPYRRWIPDTFNMEEHEGPFLPIVTRPPTVFMGGRRRRTYLRRSVTSIGPLSKLTYFKELLQSYVLRNSNCYLSIGWPAKHRVYIMSEEKLGYNHIPTLREMFPLPPGWMIVLGIVGSETPAALYKHMVVLLCENKWVLLHNYRDSKHELYFAASDLKQFMEEGLSRCDCIYYEKSVPYGVAMEDSVRKFLRNSKTFQSLMEYRKNMHGSTWTFNGMPGRLGDRVIHICNPELVNSIPADEAIRYEGKPLYFFAFVTTFKSHPGSKANVLIAADKNLGIYGYHKGRPRIRYLCKNVQAFFRAGVRKMYLDYEIPSKTLLAVSEDDYLCILQKAPCLLLKPAVFRKTFSREGK